MELEIRHTSQLSDPATAKPVTNVCIAFEQNDEQHIQMNNFDLR